MALQPISTKEVVKKMLQIPVTLSAAMGIIVGLMLRVVDHASRVAAHNFFGSQLSPTTVAILGGCVITIVMLAIFGPMHYRAYRQIVHCTVCKKERDRDEIEAEKAVKRCLSCLHVLN